MRASTSGPARVGARAALPKRTAAAQSEAPAALQTRTPSALSNPQAFKSIAKRTRRPPAAHRLLPVRSPLSFLTHNPAINPNRAQAFKSIAKRATDKVLAGLPLPGAPGAPPDSRPEADAYWRDAPRRGGVQRLVDAYVQRFALGAAGGGAPPQ